jgi:DNA-binding response OmpR family regulator
MFPLSYIIAITANDSLENKELSYFSGADKYIEKPFQYSKLSSAIRSAL